MILKLTQLVLIGLLVCSSKPEDKEYVITEQVVTEHVVNKCSNFNLTEFLNTSKNYGTDGVFDTMYQRIQFHFDKIKRSQSDNCTYIIAGFDRLKGLVTPFEGNITIHQIKENKGNIYDRETPSEDQLIEFVGSYLFKEDKNVKGSGVFSGTFYCGMTMGKDERLVDDMVEYMGDGFSNFTYDGTWASYTSGKIKICKWGQGRLPDTGDFDQGAGERYVNDKYRKNGWQINDNWELIDNPREWWKK